ncbi:CRISPR-associated endonuclease Cas3'' [Thermodesulfobacteriota bacterium]
MRQRYLGHSENRFGRVDLLRDHLHDVSVLASEFATAFGAEEEAGLAGMLHDLGKYGELFQRRLEGKERGIDHWSLGAWAALKKYQSHGLASALAIQGHHVGLKQASKDSLLGLNPEKLQEHHDLGLRLSDPKWKDLLKTLEDDGLSLPDRSSMGDPLCPDFQSPPVASMLDIRMLFSALVDADFLDTEAHFQPAGDGSKQYREPGPMLRPERDWQILSKHLRSLASGSRAASEVNRVRSDLLKACTIAAEKPPGLLTLTAPTGAGKTLSMLAFAIKHARENGLRRIVMVIPYLSIIEQTVSVFRKVFDSVTDYCDPQEYVLENHSLANARDTDGKGGTNDADMEDESRRRKQLLSQNWDAPIVVTTSVQFLESLFASRPGACRKLHRLAKSVVMLDEVQTLPLNLAVPTLATLSRLAQRYGSTVLFSTATQPAFAHLDEHVRHYCTGGWNPHEIVPAGLNLFERARRTKIEWPQDLDERVSWPDVAQRIAEEDQILCIVTS